MIIMCTPVLDFLYLPINLGVQIRKGAIDWAIR